MTKRRAVRRSAALAPFHVIAKPIGPLCNHACEYCFYREKTALYGRTGESYLMPPAVLEGFVRRYIEESPSDEVEFVWQGGEPTLAGLDFFRAAVGLQARYRGGKRIRNCIQTNGSRLDAAWCEFLAAHRFLVGLSLDGPPDVHDRYRRDCAGGPTHAPAMRGLELLRSHGVEFNVLASVTDYAGARPLEVYRFLKGAGATFIQFQPIVERLPRASSTGPSLRLAGPPELDRAGEPGEVAPWSVGAEAYGEFLLAVFDEWVRHDVGRVFVMNFEWTLGAWLELPTATCILARRCGMCLAVEHDGDVFACDHFVYPEYRLGNVTADEFSAMLDSPAQRRLAAAKETALPRFCRECAVLFACRGGCPKHRFLATLEGEPGLNYLCAGYRRYLSGVAPCMAALADLMRRGSPATRIMDGPFPPPMGQRKDEAGA